MKEERATDTKCLDSSIWIAYLFEGKWKEYIEGNDLPFISVISLFEIRKKLQAKKVALNTIEEKMNFIRRKSMILDLDEEIAGRAADISIQHNLPAIDSIIYATAISQNVELYTVDNDFRGLPHVHVLD